MARQKSIHDAFIALLFFIAIADRVTKLAALSFFNQGDIVLNSSFFSFIQLPPTVALWLTGILFVVCLVWLVRTRGKGIPFIALLYILFGMGSNITDRLVYGGVIDWIRIPGVSVFNLADVCIISGVLLLCAELFQKSMKSL